jgi:hypothetical protein
MAKEDTPVSRGMATIHDLYVVSDSSVILADTDSAAPHGLLLKRVDYLNSIDFAISLHIF